MSTSDLKTLVSQARATASPGPVFDAALAGLPDPAILQKLANEFFRAVPDVGGADALAGVTGAGVPQGVNGLSLPAPSATLPEAELRALAGGASAPVTAKGAPAGVPAALPSVASIPAMPGGFSQSDFGSTSDFGFLAEARSLFASVPAVPVNAVPVSAPASALNIPTQTPAPALAASSSALQQPGLPAAPAPSEIATPQVSGAAIPTDADALAPLGFLGDVHAIESFNGVPTLSPVSPVLASPSASSISSNAFDVQAIRRDFPILQERVNGRQLIWLDNAATTQKPQAVIDRLVYFYQHENSNIHRAAHTLAARATDAYEGAREKVRRFLNAPSVNEVIFVRGATEAINLVAQSWGRRNIQKDDEIVVSVLEHHANIVPWQMLCAEKGAKLRVAPVDNTGQILLDEYERLLSPKTKLVAITQVSNALGTVTPVQQIVEIAHRHGARVLIDGAQAVSHMRVDVQQYDCDFYVFSGHKLFAPTGIGVVFGKSELLDAMPPWQGGGNMIADVTFEKTIYQNPPWRFEAGTGNIADAVGLGAAIDYLDRVGMANIARYEHDLLVYGTQALSRIPGLRLIGTAREKASVLSFVLEGYKTEEVGAALSREGIAVRSGHHCAQPILRRFGLESTVRPSLAFYNTCDEIDALVAAIWNLKNGRVTSVV